MPHSDVFAAAPDGTMLLEGHGVRDLARKFGTPLVVMLEDPIRERLRAWRDASVPYPRTRTYYAAKAFLTTGMCRLAQSEGAGLDVVSHGEMLTAVTAGLEPSTLILHGNAKTAAELTYAIENGIGRIAVDNFDEIERLAAIACRAQKQVSVYLRIAPGIRPDTHHYVQTGHESSKFGFPVSDGALDEAVRRVLAVPPLRLVGLHAHIGSQMLSSAPAIEAARFLSTLYLRIRREFDAPLDELDVGGGLGIRYAPEDTPPDIDEHVSSIRQAVIDTLSPHSCPLPVLCVEPGRSVVGRAGVTLYTVQSVKRAGGVQTHVAVDGGMTDNPRPAIYGARHGVVAATRLSEPSIAPTVLAGRNCESGDVLGRAIDLPAMQPGDLVAVLSSGAYTYSMATHYNRVPRPAVVLASPGRVACLAAREAPEDLLRLDRIPPWLQRQISGD